MALGVSKSSVSEAVSRLEEEGLVRRIRRGPLVLVYPSGREGTLKPRILRLGIIRAAEYPFIPVFIKAMQNHGYHVDVRIYSNGLDATFDLVSGRLDLALTPMVTQLYYYALTERITIIGGGAAGGALVVEHSMGRDSYAASTKISTMEYCLARSGVLANVERMIYVHGGEDIVELLRRKKVRYAAIWEPYAREALSIEGVRPVESCLGLGVAHCCTLAAGRILDPNLREKIAEIYGNAIEEFMRDPRRWLEPYSRIIGINTSTLAASLETYTFKPHVDPAEAYSMLIRGDIKIPNPSIVFDAIEKV